MAGGSSPIGYSALTQQATVASYHLLSHSAVSGPDLANEWAELGPDAANPSVYRAASPEFEEWLATVNTAEARRARHPACEPAVRAVPVGVRFRRDPSALVTAALEVSRLTHMDATTAVAASALAGAVAASAFGQIGRDLLAGVNEIVAIAAARVSDETESFLDPPAGREFVSSARGLRAGHTPSLGPEGPDWILRAISLASDADSDPADIVGRAAHEGGSLLGAMVGALVGARVGFRTWPWNVPNSTWFAELGLRLVSGSREVRDLPVPYNVEETLTHGIERDYRQPFR